MDRAYMIVRQKSNAVQLQEEEDMQLASSEANYDKMAENRERQY